jgi:4-oxalmesaconate hydratase
MIVDAHGHLQAPQSLYAYAQGLLNQRGMEGRPNVGISDEQLEATTKANIALMDSVGTDIRFTSPRPYMMHSEKPARIVEWWNQELNNIIARQVKSHPDRFQGIGTLPQIAGESPKNCWDEMDRCVNELGFIGFTVNPDPGEGDNATPTMGDEYWYPLYEKLVQLDTPALIHSASCREHQRESYLEHFITEESIAVLNLCKSRVFQDFPNLKLVISHGGGSVPYQIGRWRSTRIRPNRTEGETFDDSMRKLYFDTCLYTQNSIDLLLKEVGVDRCLFGTEKPGVGSQIDPSTGEWFDDIKPKIERIAWLTDADRNALFEGNARKLYTRWKP